ncbi:transmembrane protein 218 isoform X1 [Phyllopteryx taeniolatus]|uniref:transmembrane protein 218 isoform X1 n=1 Tax=Phyllopteryx taeniolatus TaxID=161469 RepID=UPI002AD45122|nr:transmembrane protein 218 isoform X1 [Phyllopteryx taeniolatus]
MATTVLGVGTGVFVITAVWIVTFVLWMMLLRASGSSKLGVVPVFLLALTITLALVFFPQSTTTPSAFKEIEVALHQKPTSMGKGFHHMGSGTPENQDSGHFVHRSLCVAGFNECDLSLRLVHAAPLSFLGACLC